jgi:hypothetical protein
MTPFLQLTAEDLYQRFGDTLSEVAVVFPNNRARLFFSEHLFRAAGKPLWTPAFLTISDVFDHSSELRVCDPLALVQHLYEVHQRVSGQTESFDEFYPWGEILLSDFDDVDKNRVDAGQLFRNIKDQAAYTDTLEHLSDEQVASIRLFFKHFNPDRKTELKERFLRHWNSLLDVYLGFRQRLEAKKLAYEGMQHREVVDSLLREGPEAFPYTAYAFVGFNVLNECEIALFKSLHKAGKALFYWDYDRYYLSHPQHEAGRFMRQNLMQFPNCLPETLFDRFEAGPKDLRFVSASTENAGARFLPEWIDQLEREGVFKPEETAVVLCNEGLLLPVLHSLPEVVRELNVTMGFPLGQTPIYTLVQQIAALHADGFLPGSTPRFNHRFVVPILQHPLVRQCSEQADAQEHRLRAGNAFRPTAAELQTDALLQLLFEPVSTPLDLAHRLMAIYQRMAETLQTEPETADSYDPLQAEALFRCHTLTARLIDLLSDSGIEIGMPTFRKLLREILSKASIPFSGEPVRGMQIMGLLETRNLDFKNVLLLSVNEGMLPKGGSEVSFIPYNLRKAFRLTTMEHKDSIFAYYFFRLLQRAERVTMVYNTSTDGINRGEKSRFLLQLEMESGYPIQHFNLSSGIELSSLRPIAIEKDAAVMEALRQRYDASSHSNAIPLSPTALNAWIDCPLQFYFRYLAGLKPTESISEDIDGAMLGNFFHHTAEYIYTQILLRKAGRPSHTEAVLEALRNKTLNRDLQQGSLRGLIDTDDLNAWLKGPESIDRVVELFFRIDYFQLEAHQPTPPFNGEQLVRRSLITGFVRTLLLRDQTQTPFEIVGLEMPVQGTLELEDGLRVTLGGNMDRVDRKEGVLRIVDYKSGGKPMVPKTLEALFEASKDRAKHVFQIFVYAGLLCERHPETPICPELLYIHKAGKPDYAPVIEWGVGKNKMTVTDFHPLHADFQALLKPLIQGMFRRDVGFTQTTQTATCDYCDYKNLCRRSGNKK